MSRWRSSWLTVLGVAGAVALPAASGCGEKSGDSGKETNAGSSTAGFGGTSSGGGSSGAPSGGSGGNSSGAMGGSAGSEDTGGAAGESGGGSSSGGSGNGSSGVGGSSTSGSSSGGSSMGGMGGLGASGASGSSGAGAANGGTSGSGGAPGGMGGGGGTAPDPNVTYKACPYIGGINRMNLYKYDSARHLCFQVVVTQGNMQPFPEATAPTSWFVERGVASFVNGACPEQGATTVAATAIRGSVSWQIGSTSIPEAIDVDLVLEFPMRTDIPASESIQATGLDADCD